MLDNIRLAWMNKFTRIFLIGPMGAGKTSVGRELAKLFAYQFVDADTLIEQELGMTVYAHFSRFGEAHFRDQESLLLAQASGYTNTVFATGGGCILQAVNRKILTERGIVCYLTVSVEHQLHRLSRVHDRPLLPQDLISRQKYLQNTSSIRAPLYASVADLTVTTDTKSVNDVAIEVFNTIQELICR